MRNQCERGNACRFLHPGDKEYRELVVAQMEADRREWKQSNQLCKFFAKGTCTYGNRCGFWHPADDHPIWDEIKAEPEEPREENRKKRGPAPPPSPRGKKRSREEDKRDSACAEVLKLAKQMSSAEILAVQEELGEELYRRDNDNA